MPQSAFALLFVLSALPIGAASQAVQAPASQHAAPATFDVTADQALAAMRARAGDLHITGVAVVARLEGDPIQSWSSRMVVVGRYKDDPKPDKPDDRGTNLLAVAYAKAAQMADTRQDSGTQTRPPLTGEFPWNGGVIERGRSGYLIAAFSGGAGEQDVQVAHAGMAALKAAL